MVFMSYNLIRAVYSALFLGIHHQVAYPLLHGVGGSTICMHLLASRDMSLV